MPAANPLNPTIRGSPLASKLLRRVLSIYLTAALLITCLQLVFEYREEARRLQLELDQVAEAFLPVLGPALWNLDTEQITSTTRGIWVNPAIWRLEVHNDLQEMVGERQRAQATSVELPWYSYTYPIMYVDGAGGSARVGTLTLASNTLVVVRRAMSTFLVTIVNAVLKTLVLWLIFYYVLVRVVTRPLSTLTRATHRINPDNSSHIDSQEQNLSSLHTNDELGDLAVSFSELESSLIEKNRNIEERQARLESTIAELERASAAKSVFLAHMSHELRTPMNGVMGMVQLLSDTPLTEQQQQYLSILSSTGEQLLAVINNVLDYSEIEAGKLELESVEFDLRRVVEDCVALFSASASAKHLTLKTSLDTGNVSIVRGDPTKLTQVLANLISNAIKFTNHGGVTLSMRCASEGPDVSVQFSIADTGIGITPAQQQRLFQSFSQGDQSTRRAFGGTGLGLAICRQLVELMSGKIDVTSVPGNGSNFSFDVHLERLQTDTGDVVASLPPDDNSSLDDQQFSTLKVLVAEDNQVNQIVIRGLLRKFGIEPDIASNGAEAVEHCQRSDEHYDLVFMDIEMPILDGWEATRQLREVPALRASGTPTMIVGLSAHALSIERESAQSCGMDGYLAKPVSAADIATLLQDVATG